MFWRSPSICDEGPEPFQMAFRKTFLPNQYVMSNTATPVLIAKESVGGLHFPSDEIHRTPEERKALLEKLKNATALGNIDQHKCRITFADDEGPKVVETTIWATGEKNIVLKHGMTIPIHRIIDVNLYAG